MCVWRGGLVGLCSTVTLPMGSWYREENVTARYKFLKHLAGSEAGASTIPLPPPNYRYCQRALTSVSSLTQVLSMGDG